jgi:tryptophan synthase beta subunit
MVNQTTSFSIDSDVSKEFRNVAKAKSLKDKKRYLIRDCMNEAMRDWITKNKEGI